MSRHDDPQFPLPKRRDGHPTFDEPWQARIVGLVSVLARDDETLIPPSLRSDSPEAAALGRAAAPPPAGSEEAPIDYGKVLRLLEACLADRGIVSEAEVAARVKRWAIAYENTPHGKPVRLSAADEASTL